jgi:hypothetical protein
MKILSGSYCIHVFSEPVLPTEKKILLYADSKIQIDESQKILPLQKVTPRLNELTITAQIGGLTIHAERSVYTGGRRRRIMAGESEDRYDSRYAAYRRNKTNAITQDELKRQLDSLNLLVKGANLSAAAKNYFIIPGKIEKISNFTKAKIFGPFTPVPSAFDAGSVPEVYKFYNLSEVNEIISKLTEMSKYKYEKGDESK